MKRIVLLTAPAIATMAILAVAPSGSASAGDLCLATERWSYGGPACAAANGGLAIGVNVDGTAVILPSGAAIIGSGAAANGGLAIAVNDSQASSVPGLALAVNNAAALSAGAPVIACNGATVFGSGISCGGASLP